LELKYVAGQTDWSTHACTRALSLFVGAPSWDTLTHSWTTSVCWHYPPYYIYILCTLCKEHVKIWDTCSTH